MNLPANVTGTTSYNADNEQSTFNGTSLSYDTNVNLTSDGTNTYTWDARNHLSQITQGPTTVGSFVYDGFGRRMSKTISGTTTQFLYDGLNPVQELAPSTPPLAPVPTANLLTGLGIDEYFQRSDSVNGTLTFITDALGSPLALTNSSGAITTSYTYEPFGKVSVTNPPLLNPNTYQFTGRENDGTGLYFYRARYYNPTFQRFTGQDPIGFGSGDANLYGYVRNQPLTLLDPFGMYGTQLCDFYSEVCQANGGLSCNLTGICNNWFDKTVGPSWSNCARQCLQELEKDRKPVPNACSEKNQLDLRTDFTEHLFCWPACRINPNDPYDPFDPYAPNKDIHLY